MKTEEVLALYELPFAELVYRAQTVHRENFDPSEVQLSTLLSVKTGGCPEDCAYCPQSRRYTTGVEDEAVLALQEVKEMAGAQGQGSRSHPADDFFGQSARHGNLRDARHAEAGPGRAACRRRPRLLQ